MVFRLTVTILLFISLQSGIALAEDLPAAARLVTIDDIASVKQVGTPKLSRDGELVAYTFEGQIFIATTDGKTRRAVTVAGSDASEPTWSKDGRWLYFLSDRSGSKQLWRLPIYSFGEARQITDIDRGLNAISFSPDESMLLLTRTEKEFTAPPDNERDRPWVVKSTQMKEDASDGYLTEDDLPEHLFIYNIASKTLRQLTAGRFEESSAAWSPDGKAVVFASNREHNPDAQYRTDLWLRSVGKSAAGEIPMVRLTNNSEPKHSPRFSPDGNTIAYLAAEDGVYGIDRILLIPASGGKAKNLTASLDRRISRFEFSDTGRYIYFLYDNNGGSHLARVRVSDGKIEPLLGGERNISAIDVDKTDALALRLNNLNDAPDLYFWRRGILSRISDVNESFFSSRELGEKQKVSFNSPDGTMIEAFVTTPPNLQPDQKYPTILRIHGGPVGQFSYGYDFAAQFFAANGYVVVEPNPRGSTGRGQKFVRAIYQTWGITDYPDLIAAVDHVIEIGLADPERLAVFGYSYGGYMTNTVITQTTRFKAAASGAGHGLIAANYGHDIYQKWYNWELGVPWENREKYDRLSPWLRVGNVKTPTIFLGGRVDWNVPIINAELFYQSLKALGVDTELVVYPDSHHGGWKEAFYKDYYARIVGWFDQYTAVKEVAQ